MARRPTTIPGIYFFCLYFDMPIQSLVMVSFFFFFANPNLNDHFKNYSLINTLICIITYVFIIFQIH
jgi:hypothetical protein